jgi:large subunit ribosomal protein L17
MMNSFFTYEAIKTTTPKAKVLRRLSEKMITRARENTLHNKRIVMKTLKDRSVVDKLFEDIAPRYRRVQGGYTRLLKINKRPGDGAEMSLLELVDHGEATPAEKPEKQRR